jgi:Alternative complex III, ActD subunit
MKGVYALYPDGQSAQRAVNSLRAAGVSDAEITVISSAPMEDFEFSHIGGKNRLWYVASLGGLIGFLASTSLIMFTEKDWPLNTGGMPIVAWWPNLIIMFEMTMLGGIFATVGTLLATSGLLRRRPAFYDPAVSDGMIMVGVEDPSQRTATAAERALQISPDVQLKTV